MVLVVVLYALLALTFTLGKAAVSYADPLFLIAARMIVAGPLLLVLQSIRRGFSWRFHQRDIFDFIQVIFFHIYLSFVPEFWAFKYVSSIKVNIMYATTPFIAMFFSYLMYKEKISVIQFLASLIAFISLMPLMLKNDWCTGEILSFALPELMLLVSITSAAYAWFVIKRLMNRGYSLFVINGIAMFGGGLMSLVTWFFVHQPGVSPVYSLVPFLMTVGGLILLSNVIVYNLYGWLLNYYSVNFVACAGFLSPLFGALYGRLFLSESLGWQHWIAMAGITVGLYLFFHDELKSRRARKYENIVIQ
jgi:drug/metabolite transporter (DMT)-like permease